MSMLIIFGALVWLAAMTLVAAMCLMAARGDATDDVGVSLPVGAPAVESPPRFARSL